METAVEYGVKHLGRNILATIVGIIRSALRMRYKTHLSKAACMYEWIGYANSLLDKTKYVGTGQAALNLAHAMQALRERGDAGKHPMIPHCGWLTRRISHCGMHSHEDEGVVGGCSRLGPQSVLSIKVTF